ncbi:unnamed protein product [Prorocentrum cordatum]|uniref:Uncharacterized protein n=1 Tax=Prorocentrum cordatum TaxID=2364126 RepID=A0ABN9T8T8_9DINO|nr:unnamed protein product [Polarella glacialis]
MERQTTWRGRQARHWVRLARQREDIAMATHGDDNFVIQLQPKSKTEVARHGAPRGRGRKERERAQETGQEFMGNPQRKRPDALARAAIFRIADALGASRVQVVAAAEWGVGPQEAKQAIKVIFRFGKSAQDPSVKFVATRCFRVKKRTGRATPRPRAREK